MLSRAGFRNDTLLFHALSQQNLAQRVVYLVRTRVQEVFALEIDSRGAGVFRQTPSERKRSRAPGVILQQIVQFFLKAFIDARGFVRRSQFFQRRHQGLGYKAATVRAPMAKGIRLCDRLHRV